MFGKRFEYKDVVFQAMVERDNETIHLTGTASLLVCLIVLYIFVLLLIWFSSSLTLFQNANMSLYTIAEKVTSETKTTAPNQGFLMLRFLNK